MEQVPITESADLQDEVSEPTRVEPILDTRSQAPRTETKKPLRIKLNLKNSIPKSSVPTPTATPESSTKVLVIEENTDFKDEVSKPKRVGPIWSTASAAPKTKGKGQASIRPYLKKSTPMSSSPTPTVSTEASTYVSPIKPHARLRNTSRLEKKVRFAESISEANAPVEAEADTGAPDMKEG